MTDAGERARRRDDFRVTMMYHPSHHVLDLDEAESWFEQVFGRPSTSLASLRRGCSSTAGISERLLDVHADQRRLVRHHRPKRYVLLGVQRYPTIEQPHLKGFGWYFEGMTELYHALRRHGIRVMSQLDELAEGDDPPTAAGSRDAALLLPPRGCRPALRVLPGDSLSARSADRAGLDLAPGRRTTIPSGSSGAPTTPC